MHPCMQQAGLPYIYERWRRAAAATADRGQGLMGPTCLPINAWGHGCHLRWPVGAGAGAGARVGQAAVSQGRTAA